MTIPNPDDIRRAMVESGMPAADLADNTGPTWDTEALRRDFEVLAFAAPFVIVRRRADGVQGSLEFTHAPRLYFSWQPDA